MAAFAGALGSLAESYGMARRGLEESNLRKVQLQTEQSRLELERQELERSKNYDPLVDIKLPRYQDPITKKWYQPMWAVNRGKLENIEIPGGMTAPNDIANFYISQQDPKIQPYLRGYMQTQTMNRPDDSQGNIDALVKEGEAMRAAQQKLEDKETARQQGMADWRTKFGITTKRMQHFWEQNEQARRVRNQQALKAQEAVVAAEDLVGRMMSDAQEANTAEQVGGNAGAKDTDLLALHMQLLTSAGTNNRAGSRSYTYLQEAEKARSWKEEFDVARNHIKHGSKLSAEQRQAFVELAQKAAGDMRNRAEAMARALDLQQQQADQQLQQNMGVMQQQDQQDLGAPDDPDLQPDPDE